MLEFLLNHSIHIIFLITAAGVGYCEYRRFLRRTNTTPEAFRSSLRKNFNKLGNEILIKLVASILITLVISIVSFRVLWMNDVFHVVFLTNLLYSRTLTFLRKMFQE